MTKKTTHSKNTYDLIALDMDGTLLNTNKEVDKLAIYEMEAAAQKGKYIVLSTGRCLAELTLYEELLEHVHYGILESGAMLYDFKEEKILSRELIPADCVEEIIEALRNRDIMYQPMKNGQIYMSDAELKRLNDFEMEQYRSLYEMVATVVEQTNEFALHNMDQISKFNLYHTSQEEKHKTYEAISHLPVAIVEGEPTAYEVSSLNVSKGAGLEKLCEILGISLERTAAVGDSFNDESILRVCGYPIAMGNAKDFIKEMSHCIVSTNDRHGCAEAIHMVFDL